MTGGDGTRRTGRERGRWKVRRCREVNGAYIPKLNKFHQWEDVRMWNLARREEQRSGEFGRLLHAKFHPTGVMCCPAVQKELKTAHRVTSRPVLVLNKCCRYTSAEAICIIVINVAEISHSVQQLYWIVVVYGAVRNDNAAHQGCSDEVNSSNCFNLCFFNTIVSCNTHTHTHTHTQPFYCRLSGTTRVGRYQNRHSPTHIWNVLWESVIILNFMQHRKDNRGKCTNYLAGRHPSRPSCNITLS